MLVQGTRVSLAPIDWRLVNRSSPRNHVGLNLRPLHCSLVLRPPRVPRQYPTLPSIHSLLPVLSQSATPTPELAESAETRKNVHPMVSYPPFPMAWMKVRRLVEKSPHPPPFHNNSSFISYSLLSSIRQAVRPTLLRQFPGAGAIEVTRPWNSAADLAAVLKGFRYGISRGSSSCKGPENDWTEDGRGRLVRRFRFSVGEGCDDYDMKGLTVSAYRFVPPNRLRAGMYSVRYRAQLVLWRKGVLWRGLGGARKGRPG